jgi:hypothetical protein
MMNRGRIKLYRQGLETREGSTRISRAENGTSYMKTQVAPRCT